MAKGKTPSRGRGQQPTLPLDSETDGRVAITPDQLNEGERRRLAELNKKKPATRKKGK